MGMGKLLDKLDNSVPSTRDLYSSPSQLCLLEIRMKDTWARYVFRVFLLVFKAAKARIFYFYVWRSVPLFLSELSQVQVDK